MYTSKTTWISTCDKCGYVEEHVGSHYTAPGWKVVVFASHDAGSMGGFEYLHPVNEKLLCPKCYEEISFLELSKSQEKINDNI